MQQLLTFDLHTRHRIHEGLIELQLRHTLCYHGVRILGYLGTSLDEMCLSEKCELLVYFIFRCCLLTWDKSKGYITRVMKKQTLRSLSLSYQKRDGRAWPRMAAHGRAHPSLGMMTPTFQNLTLLTS